MKAIELKHGNYTMQDGKIGRFDVTGEYEYTITDDHEMLITNLKPIPLTEEWLETFGFTLQEEIDAYMSPDEVNILHIDGYRQEVMRETEYSIPLKYVHQLQNLYFALTEEELKPNKNE